MIDVRSAGDLSTLVEALAETARVAGAAIMEVYAQDFSVSRKDDASPVTEADGKAEVIILADLARLTPEIPVIAEESFSAGHIPEIGEGPFWLVDPLDGTKEFIKRNGEFTVNIGLIVDRHPVLGVVFAPALDELWAGWLTGKDAAAWREQQGVRESISVRQPPAEGLTVLASRSHADAEELDAFLKGRTVASLSNAGSSLKFCRLAEGAADLYPRLKPTCEWDTAAGHAVLAAAGGQMTKLDGSPFLYGKPTFLNPNFVAEGRLG